MELRTVCPPVPWPRQEEWDGTGASCPSAIRVREFRDKAVEFSNKIETLLSTGRIRKDSVSASDLRLPDELLELELPSCRSEQHKEGDPGSPSGYIQDKSQVSKALKDALGELRAQRERERECASRILNTVKHAPASHPAEPLSAIGKARRNGGATLKLELGELHDKRSIRAKVPRDEVVIKLCVHLSQTPSYESEEWLVLGSTPLCAFRDAIYCVMDENVRNVEREYNTVREQQGSDKEHIYHPGAYLYIEGTLYDDGRHSHEDLSRPIIEYLRKNNIKAPLHPEPGTSGPQTEAFTVAAMESHCFNDVQISLGASSPGLYCHQRCCEHLVVFKDVRMHNPTVDPQFLDQYPFKIFSPGVSLEHHRQCEVCENVSAKKVTYDDIRTPHSPFFWCEDCFDTMHYASGQLVYSDFKVFPYNHDYQSTLLHLGR